MDQGTLQSTRSIPAVTPCRMLLEDGSLPMGPRQMAAPAGVVLIVDDEPSSRRLLELCLKGQGYHLIVASGGYEALGKAVLTPPDVVLLDLMMPEMDGLELCRSFRSNDHLREVPVIMITALDDRETRLTVLGAGADEFLTKPVDRIEVKTRVRTIVQLNRYRKIVEAHRELLDAYDSTLEGWIRLLDVRDRETKGHTERVTAMTVVLARAAGIPEDQLVHVRRGALLHDIGKFGIPDRILQKEGALTDEERTVMRTHPTIAYDMLSAIPFLHPALDIPYCHHERFDGTGYPRRLRGQAIPQPARLFAVVDVFDALNSNRIYRKAWPRHKVLDHIRSMAGTHLDPSAVQLFLELEVQGIWSALPIDRSSDVGLPLVNEADSTSPRNGSRRPPHILKPDVRKNPTHD